MNKWLNNVAISNTSQFDGQVIISNRDINDLIKITDEPSMNDLFYGDFTKWASSLIAYPIDLTKSKVKGKFQFNKTTTDADCYAPANIDYIGYYLGEYFVSPRDDISFTDYEPYTQLKVFLPYYNWVDIPVVDVLNKYMQFRLIVDYQSGSAQYIIGVNKNSVECTYPPYVVGVDDSETRVVSVHNFQLGTTIPLGTSGTAEMIRNTALGAVKLAGTLAVGVYNVAAGAGVATSTTVTSPITSTITEPRFSEKTGRQLKGATTTATTSGSRTKRTTDYSNRVKADIRSEAFSNSMTTLSNMQVSPSIDKSNNSNLNQYMTRNIIVLIKRSKIRYPSPNYGHIYGFPLGEIKRLGTLTGYTEISSVHIEGEEFNLATQEEMSMLNEILTAGIIL